jgi:hypothetical protein
MRRFRLWGSKMSPDDRLDVSTLITLVEPSNDPRAQAVADEMALAEADAVKQKQRWERFLGFLGGAIGAAGSDLTT